MPILWKTYQHVFVFYFTICFCPAWVDILFFMTSPTLILQRSYKRRFPKYNTRLKIIQFHIFQSLLIGQLIKKIAILISNWYNSWQEGNSCQVLFERKPDDFDFCETCIFQLFLALRLCPDFFWKKNQFWKRTVDSFAQVRNSETTVPPKPKKIN